jgi:hypothetical protein
MLSRRHSTIPPINHARTSVIPTLRGKALRAIEILHTPQKNLQHAIRNTRRVPRQLMARKLGRVKRQPTLLRPLALDPGSSQRAAVVLGVVRRVERAAGVLLESLKAVPCHVLDGEEGAVGGEEHVQIAGADDGVVCVFDYALEDAVLGRARGSVAGVAGSVAVAEDVGIGALLPVGAHDGVERFLHVGAVEVDLGAWWLVVSRVDYAELREGVGTRLGDVVDVEAGIDF